jgi:uncharacterized protein with PhoU and TrkA domain
MSLEAVSVQEVFQLLLVGFVPPPCAVSQLLREEIETVSRLRVPHESRLLEESLVPLRSLSSYPSFVGHQLKVYGHLLKP